MRRAIIGALSALAACMHSDAFETSTPAVTPYGTGAEVQLTFNTDQDYWPAWTQDGVGILYAFVTPGATAHHRCIGLLPAAGGTRAWELCDNRATQDDSASSFTGYALANDGRLLYAEAVAPLFPDLSPPRPATTPAHNTLWLADTAAPFHRTALLSLPVIVGGTPVSWLSELQWTGATTFVALGQDMAITGAPIPPCNFTRDSSFADNGVVVLGTIAQGQATLAAVAGTAGATGYSLAENGASLVFTRRDDLRLFKVAATGGTALEVATVTSAAGSQLLGVSCKGASCVVAAGTVSTSTGGLSPCPSVNGGPKELRSVSLTSGVVQVVASATDVMVTPQISPVSGDVVVAVGGNLGHLQTINLPSNGNLRLFKALAP